MSSPYPPRSKKVSHDYALAEREQTVASREASLRQREDALQLKEAALRAREAAAETRADVERLMGQMREANERLIIAAIDAQNLSDEAPMPMPCRRRRSSTIS
jgi:multidrug efflux pump subunit AcrA (membrane-fusion protein)